VSKSEIARPAPPLNARKVVIVEDQRLIAEFFTYHCRALGLDVAAVCGTLREGAQAVRDHSPELLLLDFSLPDGSGLDLVRRIAEDHPKLRIIGVSSHRDSWTMLQVQRLGLHGFVDKNDQRPQVLTEAIEHVLRGQVYFTPIVSEAAAALRRDPKAFTRVLSEYELEILAVIGEGKSDEEIATVFEISPATVQSRRRDIMRKLNIHSTPKLMHYAIASGVTRPERLKLPR
jgi:DNA-binding NarL/FixJ family response regulator